MSLLDNGPDEILVYPEVESTDAYGNPVRVPAETPVPVRGRLQPSTVDEASALGQVANTAYRFIARSFPGGPWARVEYAGREMDVVGEPRVYRQPGRTRHMTTYLASRGTPLPGGGN